MKRHRRKKRKPCGVSLTELLVAALLTTFSTAVIGELMLTTVIASSRLTNQFDAVTAAQSVTNRIRNDVRSATSFSELTGRKLVLTFEPRDTDGEPLTPYSITYSLVEDTNSKPNRPTEYYLVQETDGKSIVVLKGIVGPRLVGDSSQAQPTIFSYFVRNDSYVEFEDWVGGEDQSEKFKDREDLVVGVRMDLELYRPYTTNPNTSDGNQAFHKSIAVHTEAYRREES
ncbi:MAG: hypothetical protein K2Z81_28645 [Cyanobacteria bacterium]|nr:hypothetical protein [Cyanobacteriota bacterium]